MRGAIGYAKGCPRGRALGEAKRRVWERGCPCAEAQALRSPQARGGAGYAMQHTPGNEANQQISGAASQRVVSSGPAALRGKDTAGHAKQRAREKTSGYAKGTTASMMGHAKRPMAYLRAFRPKDGCTDKSPAHEGQGFRNKTSLAMRKMGGRRWAFKKSRHGYDDASPPLNSPIQCTQSNLPLTVRQSRLSPVQNSTPKSCAKSR